MSASEDHCSRISIAYVKIDAQLAATVAAVVDEGGFDAAARRLHITPSAVSQRIKAVEQQLGRVVVVRSRPVRATEAGPAPGRPGPPGGRRRPHAGPAPRRGGAGGPR